MCERKVFAIFKVSNKEKTLKSDERRSFQMAKVENYLLGMDCGTTNIKAIILGEDGTVVAEASRPSKFMNPGPNMQEQDANEWWSNTVEIFRSLTEQAGHDIVKRIRGISVSSHTVTMLPVDAEGNPLRNAMTYQDNRSAEELHYIVDTIGFDRFVKIVGGQPAVAFLPNKILWFKKHEPELYAKTACFLQASSFINYKLTGKMTMDIDQATGMSRLGEAGESSGTTSLVFVGSDVKSAPDIPVVTKPCTIDGMPWIFDAPIQTSGAALKWFIEKMAAEEVTYAKEQDLNIYTYLNELALESKPGAGGLFFFPYLLGERAPLWNEYARGMFIGMGMDMKRSDLVRAVFEGTAFALRHVMETVKEAGATAELLRICGGGAKSRTWCQIKASMLNMPVYVMDDKSGDVPVGDALIVGHKLGVFPELTKAAEKIVKVNEIIEPVEEWVEAYDKLYPYYVEMYKHLDTDLKSLKNTVDQL